jgi:hypothetical protein
MAGVVTAAFEPAPVKAQWRVIPDTVRVFDQPAIQKLFAGKPSLVIAHGPDHKALADSLVAKLVALGVKATAKAEGDVLRKVAYPRVWNPFATVYSATGAEKKPGEVKVQITLGLDKDGKITATTSDGKDVSADWQQPLCLVTIGGEGYVDFTGDQERCYKPGVKLYIDKERRVNVIKGEAKEEKTTDSFRKKWSRPWSRLTTHHGAYQLPAQLPEAWTADSHLILLGDSKSSKSVAALQASELLGYVVDGKYPGPGKALIQYAWSPFAVEKDVIFVGAADGKGLEEGIAELLKLAR